MAPPIKNAPERFLAYFVFGTALSPIFLYSSEESDNSFHILFVNPWLLFVFSERIFTEKTNSGGDPMKKSFVPVLTGIFSGILNGLFGSGGGIVAVPLLKKSGLSVKEAHATAIFMMLCLSAVSAGIYLYEGRLDLSEGAGFIPGGIAGAICAALFFKKMNPTLLRKIFGGFVIFSAARMLWNLVSEWI